MVTTRDKVIAYITHMDSTNETTRLLVFSQPHAPEAGIQVPAGTVKPGESPDIAVLRVAHEETGLPGLELVRCLGERTIDMRPWDKDELHRRHFYHLRCPGTPPERWQTTESDPDGTDDPGPIIFALFWAPLPDGVPPLITQQGVLLDVLLESQFQESGLSMRPGD